MSTSPQDFSAQIIEEFPANGGRFVAAGKRLCIDPGSSSAALSGTTC